jgi:hypothetical protein
MLCNHNLYDFIRLRLRLRSVMLVELELEFVQVRVMHRLCMRLQENRLCIGLEDGRRDEIR